MSWPSLSLSPSPSLQTLSLQTLAQVSMERILNALPEGFLIAFFAWALLRLLRRQSSGTRFAVWFLALLAVAALPLLSGVGFSEGGALPAPGMSWRHLHSAITIPGSWAIFAFMAWAFGASLAMARLATGLWHLRRLRASCASINVDELDPAVRKTVEAISAPESLTVATSELVRVPAAIGYWRRTIILPAWALRELPPDDLNSILLHEFAHLRRGDDWTNLIQKIVRALFFFHPAVWWIENRLSVEREMACDDAVLAETANPHGYATCLVSLLEKSLAHRMAHPPADRPRSLAQAAVDRAHEASLRLARILDTNRPVATRVWKPALGMVGVFSVICLAALPLAPQFVAFDRGVTSTHSELVYSQASLQRAAVIPAAMQTGEPSGMTPKTAPVKIVHARTVAAPPASTQGVSARMNEPREQVVAINARANQETMPQFQAPEFHTLVVLETTQYVTSDSTMWRVQVWHVMLLTQVRERLALVPVVNSL